LKTLTTKKQLHFTSPQSTSGVRPDKRSVEGNVPVNSLLCNARSLSDVKDPRDEGIVPVN